VLPGLSSRPLTLDDVPAWWRLEERAAALDHPHSREGEASLRSRLIGEGFDPARQSTGGFDAAGELRALGWVGLRLGDTEHLRLHFSGVVDPAWRGRGVGRELLAWGEATARERAAWRRADLGRDVPAALQVWVADDREDLARLCAAGGLSVRRCFSTMRLDLRPGVPDAPEPPAGYRLARVDEHGTEGLREAHNEVFADHWGSQPLTPADWSLLVVDNPTFRPAWSYLVLHGEEIAGYAAVHAHEDDWPALGFGEAHLDTLGVRRTHRGHRLAGVLLAAVARRAAEVGLAAVALDVDTENPSGALGLYERAGYVRAHAAVLHAKDL
jgi:mycothiol synthase